MIAPAPVALTLCLSLAFLSFGCDRSQERAAEEDALRQQPPVETGNIGQAMRAEPAVPKLPTAQDRLQLAIRDCDRARAERSIAEGAKLDASAPSLVAAVRGKGDLAFVEWLVGRGAGIDIPDAAGRTPLSWAASLASTEQAAYLLKRGASVASVDQLGRTPLHYGIFSADEGIIILLLDAKADINAQDSLGATPLMYACAKNEPDLVKILRSRGADPKRKDKLGRTAAERAHGQDNPCVH